jgi:hypothetical protein
MSSCITSFMVTKERRVPFLRIDFMRIGRIGLSISLTLRLRKMVLGDGVFLVQPKGYSLSNDFIFPCGKQLLMAIS